MHTSESEVPMTGRKRREADDQRTLVRVLELCGAHVSVVDSGAKTASARRTPGVPDLFVMLPGFPGGVWIELKRDGGAYSENQRRWHRSAAAADVTVWSGTLADVYRRLNALGVIQTAEDGALRRIVRAAPWPAGLPERPLTGAPGRARTTVRRARSPATPVPPAAADGPTRSSR